MIHQDRTGGLDETALGDRERDDLGETGGSSGAGTRAGRGEVSGGTTDRAATIGDTPLGGGAGALAGLDGGGIAAQAAALGPAPGELADAASDSHSGAERLSNGPTGAEAVGAGAGQGESGSGTPKDRGDLGGGEGGAGPAGAARPSRDGRA